MPSERGFGRVRNRLAEGRITAAADRARDRRAWERAARLYGWALRWAPYREDLAVQAGNCLKEAGRFDQALAAYEGVASPAQRPEALFQSGDALQRAGRKEAAIAAFTSAAELGHPGAFSRRREILGDADRGKAPNVPALGHNFPVLDRPLSEHAFPDRLTANGSGDRRWLASLDLATHEPATDHGVRWEPHVEFIQVGALRLERGGDMEPLLTGVVAVRGRIVSARRLVWVDLRLGHNVVASAEQTLVKQHAPDRWLYIVNIWLDCDRLKPCRETLTLTAADTEGHVLSSGRTVNVTRTPPAFDAGDSDAFVPSPAFAYDDLTAEICARPAVVRPAARSVFPGAIKRILVMRVDQLGDVSATLPAMQRLREVFPDAELTALVPPGLAGIVEASGLFAGIETLSVTYDHVSEKRYLDEREEARFRKAIGDRAFDMAIDLCPGPDTRPVLKMVGAKYLVGFHPDEFPFLDFGITAGSRDKINRRAVLAQANLAMMLVEALALAVRPTHPAVKRQTDDSTILGDLGLHAGDYVAIHSGARHRINCWPERNFLELADRIAGELGFKVVFFSDAEIRRSDIEKLRTKARLLFPGKLSADNFDAVISNSRLMIGNDSGPKHLAAARGVDTVSIHINRLNWREWGQSSQGLIISKPVPCCGCALNNEILCGKDVACVTSITVDEVFAAVHSRLVRDVCAGSDQPPVLAS